MSDNRINKTKAQSSERLTLRLSGKDKFAIELLAQKQGVTISALIKQIIEEPLRNGLAMSRRVGAVVEKVYLPDIAYDPLVPDRLVKLAMAIPEYLTEHEKVIWKVIKEDKCYWDGELPSFKTIRDRWKSIQAEADNLIAKYSL